MLWWCWSHLLEDSLKRNERLQSRYTHAYIINRERKNVRALSAWLISSMTTIQEAWSKSKNLKKNKKKNKIKFRIWMKSCWGWWCVLSCLKSFHYIEEILLRDARMKPSPVEQMKRFESHHQHFITFLYSRSTCSYLLSSSSFRLVQIGIRWSKSFSLCFSAHLFVRVSHQRLASNSSFLMKVITRESSSSV